MTKIILYTVIILLVILIIISICYTDEEEEEREEKEEKEKAYLQLQNMTTNEILIFKNKNEFIKDVGCYDILREFYNDDQIINKVYPNYKRLD